MCSALDVSLGCVKDTQVLLEDALLEEPRAAPVGEGDQNNDVKCPPLRLLPHQGLQDHRILQGLPWSQPHICRPLRDTAWA